jgi:hypothetical protein
MRSKVTPKRKKEYLATLRKIVFYKMGTLSRIYQTIKIFAR